MDPKERLYWRRKLHAFLHDSPEKAAKIAGHEDRAAMLKALDQFGPDEFFNRQADWFASAADRFPFPKPSELAVKLTELPAFQHPLGNASIPKGKDFASEDEAFETSQKTRPFLLNSSDPKAAFICAWRFWRNWASDADPRFAFLPADTRIPDHTIWHHLSVTSAIQGALPSPEQEKEFAGEDLRPRLLLFSIGPVQDFISAARSTRDLWSGSYLLSYLVSTTLGRIALDVGPDQVIFPNLIDQPLIDHQLSKSVYSGVSFDGKSVSDQLKAQPGHLTKLLTPSLPNRFLALLPARLPAGDTSVEEYAATLVEDLVDKVGDIAERVASFIEDHPHPNVNFNRERFEKQTEKLLEIHWQTLPLPDDFSEILGNSNSLETLLPPDEESVADGYAPRKPIKALVDICEACPPQYGLRATSAWGLLNSAVAWLHDGSKSLRSFDGWREGRWESGKSCNKDSLNGKEEAVLRVAREKAEIASWCGKELKMSRGTFKPGELLGATTLIKRLWHETWLVRDRALGFSREEIREAMPMPNTRSIARGRPFAQDDTDGTDETGSDSYFAILALDGDEMGKWISGSKSPPISKCLSPKALAYYESRAPEFLKAPRAITPSWHLQFSEALGNFSLHAAQRTVESFNGRLIYAGGDDVLAMLPASEALACARALRAAFRGETSLNALAKGQLKGHREARKSDRTTQLFNTEHPGYLRLHPDSGARGGDEAKLLSDPVGFHVLVPGPATDVSVGIAIAHFNAPLQDVVKAAQAAEKRAKRSPEEGGLGRGAVAISLFKRSGEILEWGCSWQEDPDYGSDSAGYRLLEELRGALEKGTLNARFPHKLEGLLTPYLPESASVTTDSSFESSFHEVLALELDHCLSRNAGGSLSDDSRQLFTSYWLELSALPFPERLGRLINLLRTAAWMSRGSKSDSAKQLQTA